MLKILSGLFISTLAISAFAGWQTMPVQNIQPNYQMYNQGQQQMQNGINQLGNAITDYANAKAQQEYDQIVHKIRQTGGNVERSGDNIYITNSDGSKIYCYAVITEKSCEMMNY